MPESIADQLTDEAVRERRRVWAEEATDDWLAPRTIDTSEHISKKGFTREELVAIADVAELADDICGEELRKHGTLPGPDSWGPGPQMWIVVQALYREFGYVAGFMEHVRQYSAKGFGFGGKSIATFQEKSEGRATLTPTVFNRFMRNPYFVHVVRERARNANVAPGVKDAINLIEEIARFSGTKTLPAEVTRKV